MEEDFLTLMERPNAQKPFIEEMANGLQRTEKRLEEVEIGVQAMSVGLHGARNEMREATINGLQSAQAVQASQSSWTDYRGRMERAPAPYPNWDNFDKTQQIFRGIGPNQAAATPNTHTL